ncbi:DUF1828 domain-containing protein [Companilactobacillus muriivasis]|uniref:DUF1828 domain-containing protein n=1 Tax=Companilactobacillus muriivasis TaxID=3081444 RepID=UPI0030C72FCB
MDTFEMRKAYFEWLRENEKYTELSSNSIRIETPFLDNSLDKIILYVKNSGSKIVISDNGWTLDYLDNHDFTFKIGSSKYILLHSILKTFDLGIFDGEIYVECVEDNFPLAKQKILQGLIRINDLTFLSGTN